MISVSQPTNQVSSMLNDAKQGSNATRRSSAAPPERLSA